MWASPRCSIASLAPVAPLWVTSPALRVTVCTARRNGAGGGCASLIPAALSRKTENSFLRRFTGRRGLRSRKPLPSSWLWTAAANPRRLIWNSHGSCARLAARCFSQSTKWIRPSKHHCPMNFMACESGICSRFRQSMDGAWMICWTRSLKSCPRPKNRPQRTQRSRRKRRALALVRAKTRRIQKLLRLTRLKSRSSAIPTLASPRC